MKAMLHIFVLQCFMLLMFLPFANARKHKYSMVNSTSVRYTDTLEDHLNTPKLKCVALCDDTDMCSSVNHNSDTDRCELTTHIPRVLAPSTETEPNWSVYYHDPLIRGVEAWQSTTLYFLSVWLSADLAIDGNRETNDAEGGIPPCAHTAYTFSYWAMEFERFAEVAYVAIYFRNRPTLNYRNSNMRLLISGTRQDSDNDVGKNCSTYVGPPESFVLPTIVRCTQPIRGKFLKIIHDLADQMTLCEVEVYSSD